MIKVEVCKNGYKIDQVLYRPDDILRNQNPELWKRIWGNMPDKKHGPTMSDRQKMVFTNFQQAIRRGLKIQSSVV